jgi:hypothetical protein
MEGIVRVTQGAALLFAACLCLPTTASAGDWTGTGGVGETVAVTSNAQLESNSSSVSVESITSLWLHAVDEMPTLYWETDGALGYSTGPVGGSFNQGLNGWGSTALNKVTEFTDYHASFYASGLPASVSQVFDSGITNPNISTTFYSGAGGLTHQLNELNAIGLSVSGSSEFFTGDDGSPSSAFATKNNLTPYTYLTTGQSWIHNVTPLTDLTAAASTGWYAAGDTGADSLSESVTGQVQNQLSESLTAQIQKQLIGGVFTGGGGGFVVHTTAQSGSRFPNGSLDSISTGFIANAQLSYALPNNTGFYGFASHNLVPSSLGQLQEATSAGFGVGHKINESSSVGLNGLFQYQVPTTSIQGDFNQTQTQAVGFSLGYQRNLSQYSAGILVDSNKTQGQTIFSLGYQRSLSQNWNLTLSYSFTEEDNRNTWFLQPFNDNGSSNSSAGLLTITRTFNFGTPKLSGAFGSPASPGLFGSPASPGLFGYTASPRLFGSTASPSLFGSASSPDLFGSTASPNLFGSPPSPGLFGSPASPEPGGGSS